MTTLTSVFQWISSIDYAAAVSPKEWSTTVQSLLSTALTCVGGGLGPVLGGLVMDHHGPYVMFRGIGIVVAALLVVHSTVLFIFQKGHDSFLESIRRDGEEERQAPEEDDVESLDYAETEDV